jgi:predicted enzyme related to lactoylglutathione lyase
MYAVEDIEVAVAAVRTAGGEAGEIERAPYGLSALCRDDQGLPFWLGQLS